MTYYTGYTMSTKHGLIWAGIVVLSMIAGIMTAHAGGNCIELKNGYFWDPLTTNYWVPHGFAYQTINGNVFANQTAEQLDYDMREMRKMHADSLRVDFTWGNIETNDNQFTWTMTDYIVAKAEELGLRLFPLIGYQYAPTWGDSSWKAVNVSNQTTALLNYEHPDARAAYTDFLAQVTARYKDSKAIAGWILGNEYAYFDLWEANDPHLFVGYDTSYSLPSFRAYLTNLYAGNISALNANWGTAYANFGAVTMPTNYPGWNDPNNVNLQNRNYPAYHDLIQWRKKSVGDFVALGSLAVKNADTNHLRSYSMVGGIYSGFDANNTCEDAKTIVARCLAAGAALDFWSINNYAWALENNELRTAQFGITKYQDQSGLPVLVTETGHSSTDNLFPGASPRQPQALPGQVWEALVAGAIGVHIFTWNDRPMPQEREQGFGIVQQSRLIKDPVFWNIAETFRRMEQVNVHNLFGASRNPPPDINFYWSSDADMAWGRANQENCMLWGGLKRLGYEPAFIDEDDLDAGAYTNARTLLLSHAFMMQSNRVHALTNVIAAGVNIHANAALPGRYNPYHKENPGWAAVISNIFGLTVSSATNTWHGGISGNWDQPYSAIQQVYDITLPPLSSAYPWTHTVSWIKMNNLSANSGTTVVHTTEGSGYPTLQIKGHGAQGRAAINPWTLGDTTIGGGMWSVSPYSDHMVWQIHYDWNRAIYRSWFGMMPQVDISGAGYFYVVPDYRTCTNGSVLISLLNESTNPVTVTVTATNLMKGKTVERLSSAGGVLETNSDGAVSLTFAGDEYILLYAYTNNESLVNTSQYKVWIADAPFAFWPFASGDFVRVGYDTRGASLNLHLALEQVDASYTRRGETNALSLSGTGTNTFRFIVNDADLDDATYRSSLEGGRYVLHAWLANGSTPVSHTYLPTRLLWGVKPASLPASIAASSNYSITMSWQELPSYLNLEHPTPLSRADTWPSKADNTEANYLVTLALLASNGAIAARGDIGTSEGTSSNTITITTPSSLTNPPYSWKALLTAAGSKFGGAVLQSFENAAQGGQEVSGSGPEPWQLLSYGNGTELYLNRGTDNNASEGVQGSWQAYQSHTAGGYSGYYLRYVYSQAFGITTALSNIRFSFDFYEASDLDCALEMHVKDTGGNILKWTNIYTAGSWQTNSATLNQFSGSINTAAVKELVVVVGMLQPSQTYVGHIDNIRFTGADATYRHVGARIYDMIDGFEDRAQGAGGSFTAPWAGFFYADPGMSVFWVEGVDAVAAAEGSQSAFLLGQILSPVTYSGHGFAYTYTNAWALPHKSTWSNITFQFTYRETNMVTGDLLLKLEDTTQGGYEYRVAYTGGWQTIRATLNNFTVSAWPGTFNSNAVSKLAVILDSKTFSGIYYARFDNIRFEGADAMLGLGAYTGLTERAWYMSINDTEPGTDTDGDGILDAYETDTGTFNGPTDTGTDPNDPDSDNDGMNDGDEVVAGTNPNIESECFTMEAVSNSTSGFVVEWFARTGRVYGVHYADNNVTNSFGPLGTWTNITVPANGWTNVEDTTAGGAPLRFYRVTVRQGP